MQKQVWLPEPAKHDDKLAKDLCRKIIGKFTQGGSHDHKRICTRLIMDDAELDFIIADTMKKNTFISRCNAYLSDKTKLGTIVSYTDGESPKFTHLRSSMLAYVSINILSMINRFPRY